jgi:hypothetical protein
MKKWCRKLKNDPKLNKLAKMGVGLVKVLLLVVLVLGVVLISGYHKLTFGFLNPAASTDSEAEVQVPIL